MSGQCTGWVLRSGPRERAKRAVLITIADAANRDGEHAKPGMQAIVEGSLYSEGHCHRIIAELMRDGWVEQTEKPGPGKVAEYRVPMDNASHNERRSDEADSATPLKRLSNAARPDERRSPGRTVSSNYGNGYSSEFETSFWNPYPRRDGQRVGKKNTFAQWKRLSVEDQQAACRGVALYGAWCMRTNRPPKDPERFLSGRIWEDLQPDSGQPTYDAPGVIVR